MNNAKMFCGIMLGFLGLATMISGVDTMNCFTFVGGCALEFACGILCWSAMPKVLE